MTQPTFPGGLTPVVDYGTDFDCPCGSGSPGDLNPAMTMISGRIVLAQALFRRVWVIRGRLFYDPNYGLGLPAMLNGELSPGDLARKSNQIDAEYTKDERVKTSTTRATFLLGVLQFNSIVTDGLGPFPLVIQVTSATAALITPTT